MSVVQHSWRYQHASVSTDVNSIFDQRPACGWVASRLSTANGLDLPKQFPFVDIYLLFYDMACLHFLCLSLSVQYLISWGQVFLFPFLTFFFLLSGLDG